MDGLRSVQGSRKARAPTTSHMDSSNVQVVLTPLAGDIEPIATNSGVFAVGRREAPFASQPAEQVNRLSRRHARIFVEQGQPFVADLESSNGTFVNDNRVGHEPVALHDGDTLSFANVFTFSVAVETEAATEPSLPEAGLELVPLATDSDLDTLRIDSFPFLVSRYEEPFLGLEGDAAKDVRQISRRHAVLIKAGGGWQIEDLDSANGTFVNGERLDERARALHDGDTLRFGRGRFAYRIRAVGSGDTTLLDEPDEAVDAPSAKTRYISSATSFLNVFLSESADDNGNGGSRAQDASGKPHQPGSRATASVQTLLTAFGRQTRPGKRFIWLIAGALVLVGTGIGYRYLDGADLREAQNAYQRGDYLASAVTAQRAIAAGQTAPQLNRLVQEGMVRSLVPRWTALLDRREFDAAGDLLASLETEFAANGAALELLRFLRWAMRVSEWAAVEDVRRAPPTLFHDYPAAGALLEEWSANQSLYQQRSSQIGAYEPALQQRLALTMSDWRALRERYSLYANDVAALNRSVVQALVRADIDGAKLALTSFAEQNPEVRGTRALRSDLDVVATLRAASTEADLKTLAMFDPETALATSWVRRSVGRWGQDIIPDARTLSLFRDALAAWQSGSPDRAMALLDRIDRPPWSAYATRRATRYRSIARAFSTLRRQRDGEAYPAAALQLWQRLEDEDTFYRNALAADVAELQTELNGRALVAFAQARSAWMGYQDSGGIQALQRVEDEVSERFRAQALQLTRAHTAANEASRLASALEGGDREALEGLLDAIVLEVQRQRRWLNDLRVVLDIELLEAKLALLPSLQEKGA